MVRTATFTSALWLNLLGLTGLLSCGYCPALAQQFSAELVSTRENGATTPSGKIYFLNGKVRIETPDFPDAFFLIDGANGAAYFVQPTEKVFMDARQSSPLTRMLITVDPGNPCQQWQDAAKRAGAVVPGESWRCERVEETLAGRSSVAYRATSSSGQSFLGWIDPELKFPLRLRTTDGTIVAVENIRKEPQSERLFEIPAEFGKFDPESLIKLIQQSDVWVSDE